MKRVYAEIQIPIELRELIREKKGLRTYEYYFKDLMKAKELQVA